MAKTGEAERVQNYERDVDRWFDVYFARMDEGGRFVAIVFNDITERKCAEAALRESREELAADLANTEMLRGLAERLVTEARFETIYDEVLSGTIAVAQADAGTIQIYHPETKSLELIASKNFSRTITDYFHRVDARSRTACGIALNTGQRAFVDFPDEASDPGCVSGDACMRLPKHPVRAVPHRTAPTCSAQGWG